MATGFAVQTAAELVIAVALIVGFCFEDKVAAWERRVAWRIRRAFGHSNVIELDQKRSPRDEPRAM